MMPDIQKIAWDRALIRFRKSRLSAESIQAKRAHMVNQTNIMMMYTGMFR